MADQLYLKRELFSLLSWHLHRTDSCPRETLDRLVKKGTGIDISDLPIRIRELEYRLPDLVQIRGDMHESAKPKNEQAPLILFAHPGGECILDGQNRINLWERTHNIGPHRCLIVSRKGNK